MASVIGIFILIAGDRIGRPGQDISDSLACAGTLAVVQVARIQSECRPNEDDRRCDDPEWSELDHT
jgi:hypothetical protein